jgi:hypothetical protein
MLNDKKSEYDRLLDESLVKLSQELKKLNPQKSIPKLNGKYNVYKN